MMDHPSQAPAPALAAAPIGVPLDAPMQPEARRRVHAYRLAVTTLAAPRREGVPRR